MKQGSYTMKDIHSLN